jgi:hypothetical protein
MKESRQDCQEAKSAKKNSLLCSALALLASWHTWRAAFFSAIVLPRQSANAAREYDRMP